MSDRLPSYIDREWLDGEHPVQYGFLNGQVTLDVDNPNTRDRMNRCPKCEEWSPCRVREMFEYIAALAILAPTEDRFYNEREANEYLHGPAPTEDDLALAAMTYELRHPPAPSEPNDDLRERMILDERKRLGYDAPPAPTEDGWTCDWTPDDLNPGPECPYCEGRMCGRMDGLGPCTHNRRERHGYPAPTESATRALTDLRERVAATLPYPYDSLVPNTGPALIAPWEVLALIDDAIAAQKGAPRPPAPTEDECPACGYIGETHALDCSLVLARRAPTEDATLDGLQRWEVGGGKELAPYLGKHPEGHWVWYEDVVALLARLRAQKVGS